jgi:pimeloyl-ACP methyl ester carboxylesterase
LTAPLRGLAVTPLPVTGVPALVYRPAQGGAAPVVVIAHGFAGSQQMMQPFATTLAQAGYVAVTFDFPGHGRNPAPLAGGLSDDKAAAGALLGALGRVVAAARPLGDGRLALLGHSMASDIVVRWALEHPEAEATIALSLFGPEVTADRPRDLLVILGAWEPEFLQAEARRVVGMAVGGAPVEGVTYGDMAAGTARRLVIADGVLEGLSLADRLGLQVLANLLLFGGFPLASAWLGRVRLASALRWARPGWQACAAALLLGVSLWPLAHELLLVLRAAGFTSLRPEHLERVRDLLGQWREFPAGVIVLALAVVPAVLEELFFRGYLFSALLSAGRPGAAVVGQAALFALFHLLVTDALAVERLPPSLLLGLVLG